MPISPLSLGTWQTLASSDDAVKFKAVLHAAFDAGINSFDTADSYALGAAETELGALLADLPRSDYVLTTKCFFPLSSAPTNRGLSRKHITDSVHASLSRLKMDYIDVMMCHRFDEKTPLTEIVSTMENLIRQGKILYWGVSSWTVDQLKEVRALAGQGYQPIVVQSGYNLLNRQQDAVIDYCHTNGMGFVAYSPLSQGVLTGKYISGIPAGSRAADEHKRQGMRALNDENLARVKAYQALAEQWGISLTELALSWCLARTGMTSALCGASSPLQLSENIKAAAITLTPAQLTAIGQVSANA